MDRPREPSLLCSFETVAHEPWLQTFAAENACGRIVCFPRAGGTTTDFAEWAGAFGDIEVCAVQLPGRLRRYGEPAMRAVEPTVQEVVQALQELEYLPLVLFGDCMGAIFAFEIARQLRRKPPPSYQLDCRFLCGARPEAQLT